MKKLTKTEAEALLKTQTKEHKQKYCPLIKGNCLGEKCVAFHPGFIGPTVRENEVRYISPRCVSPLITGVCDLDNG